MFEEGHYPPCVHGKDPLLMENYRGITLSSVMVKLFEIILLQAFFLFLKRLVFQTSLKLPIKVACLVAMPSMLPKKLFSLKLEKVEISTSVFMTLRKLLTPLSYPCS